MDPVSNILQDVMTQISAPEDYFDEQGFLVCGKCHTRKQREVEAPVSFHTQRFMRMPVLCDCQMSELEAEERANEKRKFQQRMETLRRDGITDPAYLHNTFEQDDRRNPEVSDVCRKYVENWEEMKANNIGILFYGDVGAGKSFLACCIANALLERLVSVSVTNFPRILNQLQGAFGDERQTLIDRLQRYSLIVIDDLGVERDTSYSAEQIFNVVDTRSRSGNPLIVTTNLSVKDLRSAPTLAHKRIYDRVLEMCPIRLKLVGESRRDGIAKDKRDRARKLLSLE